MSRPHTLIRYGAVLLASVLLALSAAPGARAQAPGTTPIPANTGWDEETQKALDAINADRAAQQPPLPPLVVEATLQNIAAWMAHDQIVTRSCLARQNESVVTCRTLDSLIRTAAERLAAFGYQGTASELYGWAGLDGVTEDITTGQGMVRQWINSTTRTEPALLVRSTSAKAIGLARVCAPQPYGNACIWWAYFGANVNQAFGPAAPAAPAPAPAPNPAPAPPMNPPADPPPAEEPPPMEG